MGGCRCADTAMSPVLGALAGAEETHRAGDQEAKSQSSGYGVGRTASVIPLSDSCQTFDIPSQDLTVGSHARANSVCLLGSVGAGVGKGCLRRPAGQDGWCRTEFPACRARPRQSQTDLGPPESRAEPHHCPEHAAVPAPPEVSLPPSESETKSTLAWVDPLSCSEPL